jgi:Ca2+/Na+ antiporter
VKQHTKDAIVIPIVIGVLLLLAGLPLSAWYTNQPVRTVVTWAGIKDILFAQVSAWTDIVLLLALVVVGYLLYRAHERYKEVQRESDARHATNLALVEHMQEKEKEHKAALQTARNGGPKIHVAWNQSAGRSHGANSPLPVSGNQGAQADGR